MEDGEKYLRLATRHPSDQIRLLNPSAATLNQNDQHDNEKRPGYNPDNRGCVHIDSLPS
jgi:hypothetical protein